ncbi:MAG: hypothetical protein HY704_05655 [Gemmatimonadetes bacterium]|nr:hypothetical protein [Gemmatimonadota bacterium]
MSFGLEPRTRERIIAVALLVSIFMAGVLTALVVGELMGRSRPPAPAFAGGPPFRGPGMGPPSGRPGRMGGPLGLTEMLAERLDLGDEQERKLEAILERRRAVSDSILEQMRPRLQAQLDSTRTEIREILTPEQREEFDRYAEEGRLRLFRRMEAPPFGGGPPVRR